MAYTITPVVTGNRNIKIWTLACLDADDTTNIAHGMGVAPEVVAIQPLVSYATAAIPVWGVVAVTATNITVQKSTNVGSATGLGQIAQVTAWRPHSFSK